MIHIWMALVLSLLVAVIHLLLCRQFKKEYYFGLFLLLSIIGFAVLWIFLKLPLLDPSAYSFKSLSKVIYIFSILFYFYIYRLVNQVTPSKKIIMTLEKLPEASYESLLYAIRDGKFIESALEALIKNGYVRKEGDRFFLTTKGGLLAFSVKLDQKLFLQGARRI